LQDGERKGKERKEEMKKMPFGEKPNLKLTHRGTPILIFREKDLKGKKEDRESFL